MGATGDERHACARLHNFFQGRVPSGYPLGLFVDAGGGKGGGKGKAYTGSASSIKIIRRHY